MSAMTTPEQQLVGFTVWLKAQTIVHCATCGKTLDLGIVCRDHADTGWVLVCICGVPVVQSTPWMIPTPREVRGLLNA